MKKKILILIGVLVIIGCNKGLSSEVSRKTINADKAIENYEWFKRQEQQIKSMNIQEEIQQKALDDFIGMLSDDKSKWSLSDKREIQFLRTVVDGTRMQVNSMIAEYNARTTMKHKELFHNNLPTNIVRGLDLRLEFKYDIDSYNQGGN